MDNISIGVIIITGICCFFVVTTFFILWKLNAAYQRIKKEYLDLTNTIQGKQENIEELDKTIQEKTYKVSQLEQLDRQYNASIETVKKLSLAEKDKYAMVKDNCLTAFENFVQTLEQDYDKKSQEYDDKIVLLSADYKNKIDSLKKEIAEEEEKVQDIKKFRKAAQEAIIREKELKQQQHFYCLTIDEKDKNDIALLEKVKLQLVKPRILSMLIWSTWFQKPMTSLCNNVLGTNTVVGIYKITNIITNECYVGQAVDVASRFKQHAKCGLGIDTPAGNKLYKAMQEYGIWNFSWELLEKCDKSKLNERERYYIELYMSKDFGYNSNKGVK